MTTFHFNQPNGKSPREFCGGLLTGLDGNYLRIIEVKDESLIVLDLRTNQTREIIKEESQ
jgi:hypothetical protein